MNAMTPLVMSVTDAAHYLGLSESTLNKLRLTGGGPVYCKLGRRVVYRSDDLSSWLESKLRRSTADSNE